MDSAFGPRSFEHRSDYQITKQNARTFVQAVDDHAARGVLLLVRIVWSRVTAKHRVISADRATPGGQNSSTRLAAGVLDINCEKSRVLP
jgi:hypothetical protein